MLLGQVQESILLQPLQSFSCAYGPKTKGRQKRNVEKTGV